MPLQWLWENKHFLSNNQQQLWILFNFISHLVCSTVEMWTCALRARARACSICFLVCWMAGVFQIVTQYTFIVLTWFYSNPLSLVHKISLLYDERIQHTEKFVRRTDRKSLRPSSSCIWEYLFHCHWNKKWQRICLIYKYNTPDYNVDSVCSLFFSRGLFVFLHWRKQNRFCGCFFFFVQTILTWLMRMTRIPF